MTTNLQTIRNILAGETQPIDAYRLSRKSGYTVQECGRALIEMAGLGEISGLRDSGGNPLSERYVKMSRLPMR